MERQNFRSTTDLAKWQASVLYFRLKLLKFHVIPFPWKKSIFNLWKVIKFLSFFIQFIKKSDISIIVVPKLFLVFTIWNEFWILQKKKELLTFNPYFFTFLLFTLFFSKFQKFPFYCSHDFFPSIFETKITSLGVQVGTWLKVWFLKIL